MCLLDMYYGLMAFCYILIEFCRCHCHIQSLPTASIQQYRVTALIEVNVVSICDIKERAFASERSLISQRGGNFHQYQCNNPFIIYP